MTLIDAAEKLLPLAAEHSIKADADRSLAAEVVTAISEAGFARHFVPSRWGGQDGSIVDLTQAIVALGAECANAAWLASLSAYAGRIAAFLPEQGQREIWAYNPDTLVVAALVPTGSAEKVHNGWNLKGKWNYCSGIDTADWALLCGPAGDRASAKFFAVPRHACTIIPTWDSIGMRATASHTVEVDTFVPEHMVVSFGQFAVGDNDTSRANCHRVPIRAVGNLAFFAPGLGAATGALNAAIGMLSKKPHHTDADLLLVRASAQIDAARLLIERISQVCDDAPIPEHLVARNERDSALGAELLTAAVDALVRACGTAGLSETYTLQRFWRDTICASSHVALRFETAATRNYGAVLYGQESSR